MLIDLDRPPPDSKWGVKQIGGRWHKLSHQPFLAFKLEELSNQNRKPRLIAKKNTGLHISLALCDFDDLIANNLMKRDGGRRCLEAAKPFFVLFLRHESLSLPRSRVAADLVIVHSDIVKNLSEKLTMPKGHLPIWPPEAAATTVLHCRGQKHKPSRLPIAVKRYKAPNQSTKQKFLISRLRTTVLGAYGALEQPTTDG